MTAAIRPRCLSRLAAAGCARLIALIALFAATAADPAAAADDATVKAQHGDWQVVCKQPAGAKSEVCALVQDVTSESNPNIGLSVQFQASPDGTHVLRVFAPLGILLPPGLGLQIDEVKIGHAPFVRCQVVGCVAQVTVTADILEKFKAGTTAWFIVYQSKEAGIGIPVSLKGLADGIVTLK
ncbi:MAG: invasion associated locus B family protein [Hyphomicrobiaceae bacterium]